MANRIVIAFTGNPLPLEALRFVITDTGATYSRNLYKRFISGVPTGSLHVQIDSDLHVTLESFVENVSMYDIDSVILYSSDATNIYIDFTTGLDYGFALTAPLPTGATMTVVTTSPPVVNQVLNPLPIDDFQIEIIDTYNNGRPLIINLTQMSSPQISWDGGDELDAVFMASKLLFNMLVEDAADGKFFHLFTGDEKRYMVKLNTVDAVGNVALVWKGFLLPDFYKEPYKNVSFFVEFTATDMLGQLKGKTFPKWYYSNSFPIMRLIAYILLETGLDQPFIVAPSLLNASLLLDWKDIAISLSHYRKGEKLTDIYVILQQVLKANGLTLTNFRGYWFIKGITRKHEAVNYDCLTFDLNGNPTGKIDIVNLVTQPIQSREMPIVTAETPWKKVSIDFNPVSMTNIFPDDVVYMEYSDVTITNALNPNAHPSDDPNRGNYKTALFDYWKKIGGAPRFVIGTMFEYDLVAGDLQSSVYGMDEATSQNNYLEYQLNPYLLSSENYVLELDAKTEWLWDTEHGSLDLFNAIFNSGAMYYGFMFQLFVGQNEVASNRPSFPQRSFFTPKMTNNGRDRFDGFASVSYSLKCDIKVRISGPLSFRVLMPLWSSVSSHVKISRMMLKNLKLTLKKEKNTENTVAVRNINFTKEYNSSIDLSSSTNGLLLNNMPVKKALNMPFFTSINLTNKIPKELWQYQLLPNSNPITNVIIGKIIGSQYTISHADIDLLFKIDLLRKNLFIEKSTGEELPFEFVAFELGTKLFSIESIVDFPLFPSDYIPQVSIDAGDTLKVMDVKFAPDDILVRDKWYLYGSLISSYEPFTKTLARALHQVKPETLYSLETTFLQMCFPNELIEFYYYNENRVFIPTSFSIDLSRGKTTAKCIEAKYQVLTDITYE